MYKVTKKFQEISGKIWINFLRAGDAA